LTAEPLPDTPSPSQAPPSFRGEWVRLLGLLLLLLSLTGYWLYSERVNTALAERLRLQAQAQVIAQNIERQLAGVNAALAGVRYDLVSGDRNTETNALTLNLKVLADAMPGVRSLMALDAQGKVTGSNLPALAGQNFSQSEFFKTPQAGLDATTLYVSPPYKSLLDAYVLNVTRVMIGSDGKFFGIVSAALDPDYLEIVMRSVLYADDMVARLAHGDGRVLLASPQSKQVAGTALAGTDSAERMVAIRNVMPAALRMDKPLIVEVSRDLAAVYGPWRLAVVQIAAFCLLAMLATCTALYLNQRRRAAAEHARAKAQEIQRQNTQQLAFALRGADLGLWDWNVATNEMLINDRQWQMLGYTPGEVALTSAMWRGCIHPDDQAAVKAAFDAHVSGHTESYKVEHRMRHKKGHWIWVLNHAMVMARDAQSTPTRVLGTHLDITERKSTEAGVAENSAQLERANAQLSRLSVTDGLTGIGNRRLFDATLATEWARGARQQQPLALLIIDIDHFKAYNDSYGHQGGDDCLRRVAGVLGACVKRSGDLLARYGGEEFVVLLPSNDALAGTAFAQACLDRLNAARIPHPASPVSDWLTMSIGVASMVPAQGVSPDLLVRRADAALYAAKKLGRAQVACADPSPSLL
jgi:diguanylate cyclase (GGDEF)-like protein/PAS domain S-box-containing protein